MDSSGNVVATIKFPSPVTGLAASSTGTLLLALANWQELIAWLKWIRY